MPEGMDDLHKEIVLHRAVLDLALLDLFSTTWYIKKDTEEWLHLDNPYFRNSCARAILDPDFVMMVFIEVRKILTARPKRVTKIKKKKKKSNDLSAEKLS